MTDRIFPLLLLTLVASSLVAEAQPLRLGSSREQVMKEVYRAGAYSDTLREGSYLFSQVRRYPDTSETRHYAEVIRIAPVRMFEINGYASFIFDSTGRLYSYHWSREDMSNYVLSAGWKDYLTWSSDVTQEAYNHLADSLKRVSPPTHWTDSTKYRESRMRWHDKAEVRSLDWSRGALTYSHQRK